MSNDSSRPNIVLFGIDSLRADYMSCYGFPHLTTPHLDLLAEESTLWENYYSPHIPTSSGYSSMLTGRDVFGTNVVALRHQGDLAPGVRTLAEITAAAGYNTTSVGFEGNVAARGFQKYIPFSGWGSWETRPSRKAENLNEVTVPEINRLAAADEPFFILLRHMDPHSPYLPPAPYDRMFYHGNETDPANHSLDEMWAFKPFADYFASWMPPGCTDTEYVNAQYAGAVAYMDACIAVLLNQLETLGILDETIVVITSDHGETLDEHACWYDHHGMYDNTLHVPLFIRYPEALPMGLRLDGYARHQDLVPTILELAGISAEDDFDGDSLMDMVRGEVASHASEFYITECTWMRKHGWRTPEWKLMVALEPDFHFKPEVELYNLIQDPLENNNVAEANPDLVATLRARMEAHIAERTAATGRPNPIEVQGDWHGHAGVGAFKSSQQAFDTLHIGDPGQAQKLQAELRK
ncbi:MAG TPA: sulfatase [Armatimonadetes bacterium]|nr:sulfatase [Armatimonadota bacterium]